MRYVLRGQGHILPGRISESEVQNLLKGLEQAEVSSQQDLRKDATRLSQALLAFESVFSGVRDLRSQAAAQVIVQLQNRLGPQLNPRTGHDVELMNIIFSRCLILAAGSPSLGAKNPPYPLAFFSQNAKAIHSRIEKELQDATANARLIEATQQSILQIEQTLDKNELGEASALYQGFAGNAPEARLPQSLQYLASTAGLREDLLTYSQISAGGTASTTSARSLQTQIRKIEQEQAVFATAVKKPVTAAFLRTQLNADKKSLKEELDSLPDIRITAFQQRSLKSTMQESTQRMIKNLASLQSEIQSSHDLSTVVGDQKSLALVATWFGKTSVSELQRKGNNLKAALALENLLTTQIANNRVVIAGKQTLVSCL